MNKRLTKRFLCVKMHKAVENTVLVFALKAKTISPKGGRKMNKYELMFIIAQDVAEEKREELIAKFKSYVESHGGQIEGVEKVGMKKFAYPINFKNEGYYVIFNMVFNPEEVDAMNKLMTITDGIVRQMFVRK